MDDIGNRNIILLVFLIWIADIVLWLLRNLSKLTYY